MKLIDKIKQYNEAYRNGEPLISDIEYDALVEQLRNEDPNNEWFQTIEPATVSNGRKRKLPIPMKSLNKVKSIAELKSWAKSLGLHDNTIIVCMPKFDGLSLLRNESTGEAYSRGGTENEGQDCTAHYNACTSCQNTTTPLRFTYGEFVIDRDSWKKHFEGKVSELSGDKFKSPRNTAAGLLNRDEPCKYLQYTSFFRYGADSESLKDYLTFKNFIEHVCTAFQQPHLYAEAKLSELTEQGLLGLYTLWNQSYPIDGVVVYINDLRLWETIGRHQTTGNPLYAVAYKHPDFTESFETTVKDVVWKVSKSGALKPVVNIEMVDTGDCNMENPTGYNAGWISDNNIAKGAKVLVTRSGGVIPKILKTIEAAPINEQQEMWDSLTECPHCGYPTAWNASSVELCCNNPQCPGILLAKAVHFYNVCGAENMGEETLSKIYDAGFRTIKEMINITANDLLMIEGFGEAITNIVLSNNKKIMEGVDLATLMHASDCFEGIGKIKAQKILDDMDEETLDSFCNRFCIIPKIDSEEFRAMSKTQQSFVLGVQPFFRFLIDTGITIIKPVNKQISTDGKCSGLSVCVSGFRDSELEQAIINNGGKIVSGVSKKTSILVVKDLNATSSKISKAQSLNIPCMTIEDFKEFYNI